MTTSSKPKLYSQNQPWIETLAAGQVSEICNCGKTKAAPYCDHSSSPGGCQPYQHSSKQQEIVLICGCKRSQTMPFCDGSHNKSPNNTPARLFWDFIRNPFK